MLAAQLLTRYCLLMPQILEIDELTFYADGSIIGLYTKDRGMVGMNLLGSGKMKVFLAREGLIIAGIALVLHFLTTIFLQNVPVVLPKYKLEFLGDESYTISIFPKIRNDNDYQRLLEEIYNPSPRFIDQRIREFTKTANIRSELKSSTYINPKQVYLSKLYSRIVGTAFILKLFAIYLSISFIRFIILALRILMNRS